LALGLLIIWPALLQAAGAHATLVIGNLQFSPDPPLPGAQLEIRLRLEDTLLTPVEKAHVRIELRDVDVGEPGVPASAVGSEATEFLSTEPLVSSGRFSEAPVKGTYLGRITAPAAGAYTLSVRDTTFMDEEAVANVSLVVGGAPNGVIDFVLPPTPIGPKSLSTWLVWLVGLPLLVGVITTLLVLRKTPAEGEPSEGEPSERKGEETGG
jgi:hypothetical protein